jgi:hypothetical protein
MPSILVELGAMFRFRPITLLYATGLVVVVALGISSAIDAAYGRYDRANWRHAAAIVVFCAVMLLRLIYAEIKARQSFMRERTEREKRPE